MDDQSEISEVMRMAADGKGVLKCHVGSELFCAFFQTVATCVESSGERRRGSLRSHSNTKPLCARSFCATGASAGCYTSVQENTMPYRCEYYKLYMRN